MYRSLFLLTGVILWATMSSEAADLDIRRVVLYKHGVGFFERAGNIAAGDRAQLSFKAGEMNDVLKSLTIEQQGGEGVSAVRYDSSDPLSKRLEVFPFAVGEAAPLGRILDQFKGSEIELRLSSGNLRGTIVSARTAAATSEQPERHELLLLVDGELRNADPAAASGIRFAEEKIQQQFQEYLGVLAQSRNRGRRTVTIESSGGASEVAASYVAPAPVWKSSYRLIFGEGGRALLEGWAIVDNTTGEDWSNVSLSLVSGLPVSFISKLYEPQYVERPVVQLTQDRAWRPQIHGGAIEEREAADAGIKLQASPAAPAADRRRDEAGQTLALSRKRQALRDADPSDILLSLESSIAEIAVGADLGDLFEYRMERPVTIKKGESAMLPFVRQPIEARRLILFNEENDSQHPLQAAELTNSSGTTLDGGAITVYEAGAYAGEALVESIKSGDKRLISYAVDLGARITTAFDTSSKLQSKFTYRRGVLTTRTARKNVKTFTIRNVDNKAKTVVIEHPVSPEYKLIGVEPTEKTADAYRFEVAVEAGATAKFAVTEERVHSQTTAVANLDYQRLMSFVRNEDLDDDGRQKLAEIAEVKRQIAENERAQQSLEKQIQNLIDDQQRLRQNISTLRSTPGQDQRVQQYADTLAAAEAELATLRDRQAELERQREQLQQELDRRIETLEI